MDKRRKGPSLPPLLPPAFPEKRLVHRAPLSFLSSSFHPYPHFRETERRGRRRPRDMAIRRGIRRIFYLFALQQFFLSFLHLSGDFVFCKSLFSKIFGASPVYPPSCLHLFLHSPPPPPPPPPPPRTSDRKSVHFPKGVYGRREDEKERKDG